MQRSINQTICGIAMLLTLSACATINHTLPAPASISGTPAIGGHFSSAASITTESDCFSGRYASYAALEAPIDGKHTFETMNLERFYPRAVFERRQQQLNCRRFIYQVGEVFVEGHVVMPKRHAGVKLPVVIYNRGGNHEFGLNSFATLFNRHMALAEQGFIVISSQYRGAQVWPSGTTMNTGKDEFGGKDVDDVRALIPVIDGIPSADPQRIGMFGVSRGGMMTYLAAQDTPRIKAIAVKAGVTDFVAEFSFRADMVPLFQQLIPDFDSRREQVQKQRSVMYWLDRIDLHTPILLLHGDADDRVSVQNSTRFAELLKARGQEHKLVVYPKADHVMWPHEADADREVLEWFRAKL